MSSNKNIDKKRSKKRILTTIIIILSLLIFISISAVISIGLIYKDSIHSGIYIENVDIGGLTVIEANDKIEETLQYVLESDKLILKYNDHSWNLKTQDIGLKYDFLKAVNDAYLIGRRGTYLDRIKTMADLLKRPYNMSLKSSLDMEKINSILNVIEKDINRPSLNATIRRENGKFNISNEVLGLKLNKEKTAENISEALLNSKFYDTVEIDLTVDTVKPKYTAESLSQIKDLLGSYTTKFNTKIKGRSYNVNLASKSINGVVLLPGEIFSFNNIVGPRTAANGYQVAPVILKGELVDGIGGGVCQISSTLYNSVLKSNLGVVERTNHTIPSTYVPMGLDATVSYGVLDLKFQNNSEVPVYIESIINGNKVTVNIYGKKASSRTIKLTSHIDKVIKKDTEIIFDNKMYEGQQEIEEKGRNGYKVSSYMLIYEDGKVVERRLITKDYYKPSKEIIKKGTKKDIEDDDDAWNEQNDLEINN